VLRTYPQVRRNFDLCGIATCGARRLTSHAPVCSEPSLALCVHPHEVSGNSARAHRLRRRSRAPCSPEGRWMPDPAYLVAAALALASVALAGPTWRRELPSFVEDKAPLMIALAVGNSMATQDVAPSLLERAKQKISDLLIGQTNISAYSFGLVGFETPNGPGDHPSLPARRPSAPASPRLAFPAPPSACRIATSP
jgi:hypothetical protein